MSADLTSAQRSALSRSSCCSAGLWWLGAPTGEERGPTSDGLPSRVVFQLNSPLASENGA